MLGFLEYSALFFLAIHPLPLCSMPSYIRASDLTATVRSSINSLKIESPLTDYSAPKASTCRFFISK